MLIPIRPHQIYHVTVMPCFDKKLEASRSDFYNDLYKTRDVDCVITSGEEVSVLLDSFIAFTVYRRGGDYVTGQGCGIENIRVTAIR